MPIDFMDEAAWLKDWHKRDKAAPDLLEALESLFDAVDSCVELTPKVMEQARAAIAKARGQS